MIASPSNSVETIVEPDFGPRNRLTVFFRFLLAIPFVILASMLGGNSFSDSSGDGWMLSGGSALLFGVAIVIVFSATYPVWILSFIHGLQAFELKVGVYALLLRDEMPSLDDRPYAQVLYPDIEGGAKLNRFMPLVKWFLAIPHYIVLFFTGIGVFFVTVLAWIAILFTGKYPQGFAPFVIGWLKYYNRVVGYAFALVTDQYPQFRLA